MHNFVLGGRRGRRGPLIRGEGEMLERGMGLADQPVDIVREKRAETEYNHSLACAVVHNYA